MSAITTKTKYDTIIVGQGLAGTLLAFELIRRGHSIVVYDSDEPLQSTPNAAGIVNPIIIRKPSEKPNVAVQYKKMEEAFGFIQNICRTTFFHPVEGNVKITPAESEKWTRWYAAAPSPYIQQMVHTKQETTITLSGTAYLDALHFGQCTRAYFKAQGWFRTEKFEYDLIKRHTNALTYKDIEANQIIFCEGCNVTNNPWFNHLPWAFTKGEMIKIENEHIEANKLIYGDRFLLPVDKHKAWIGATYSITDLTSTPTAEAKSELEQTAKTLVKGSFTTIAVRAALRPSLRDRHPVLGFADQTMQIGIFNGLGSKGVLTGPFRASEMANLIENHLVQPEKMVNISRFNKK